MIIIPSDLSGNYPDNVTNLLKELKSNYQEENDNDRMFNSSRYGCDCGCGGDSWAKFEGQLMEDRDSIIQDLLKLGYKVKGEYYP